ASPPACWRSRRWRPDRYGWTRTASASSCWRRRSGWSGPASISGALEPPESLGHRSVMRVAIAGASGLIGSELSAALSAGGDEALDESAAPGRDFLAGVVTAWEAEAARAPGRSVFLRTGIVLSARGGALQQMLPPFKAFVGGPIGSGKQWFPWIHLADEVSA